MTNGQQAATSVSDTQLLNDSIAGLKSIKPRIRFDHSVGLMDKQDWGPLGQEYGLLCLLQQGAREAIARGKYEDGREIPTEHLERLRLEIERRESENPWFALAWGRGRLSELLIEHVDDAVYPAPHPGFSGPNAGNNQLAFMLREATSVEWLLHCPERCNDCRIRCANDLQRLRRAIDRTRDEARRRDPRILWRTLKAKPLTVEVYDGTRHAQLTRKVAELFLAVAERHPQQLAWNEFIRAQLEQAAVRQNGKQMRRNADGEEGRVLPALRSDTIRRRGNRLKESLGALGSYWKQDGLGATWQPPDGSGPVID